MLEILAEVGAFILFFVNVPQLIRTIKNRNNLKDLSVTTQILYLVVGFLYGAYGWYNNLVMLWTYNIYAAFYFTLTISLIMRCKVREVKVRE